MLPGGGGEQVLAPWNLTFYEILSRTLGYYFQNNLRTEAEEHITWPNYEHE
jgi:hypothetical protein